MRVIIRAGRIEVVFVVAAVRRESKLEWMEEADVESCVM